MGSNGATNGEQAREAAAREEAQNMEIGPFTRAAGIAAIALMPKHNRPNGPTQADLRSMALVKQAMELGEEADAPVPPLYLGSEND